MRVWVWVVSVRLFALFWMFALFWYVFYRLRGFHTRRIAIPFAMAMVPFGLLGNLLDEGYRLALFAGVMGVLVWWFRRDRNIARDKQQVAIQQSMGGRSRGG